METFTYPEPSPEFYDRAVKILDASGWACGVLGIDADDEPKCANGVLIAALGLPPYGLPPYENAYSLYYDSGYNRLVAPVLDTLGLDDYDIDLVASHRRHCRAAYVLESWNDSTVPYEVAGRHTPLDDEARAACGAVFRDVLVKTRDRLAESA